MLGPLAINLTEYHPAAATTAAQRLMEGGTNDRKGRRLHTVQEHQADPIAHPYVALSGDDVLWPYGQRVVLSTLPNLVARVVDTGGNFSSRKTKKIRRAGAEPIDVCVRAPGSIATGAAELWIVEGDVLDPRTGRPATTSTRPAIEWWGAVAPSSAPLIVARLNNAATAKGVSGLLLLGMGLGAAALLRRTRS